MTIITKRVSYKLSGLTYTGTSTQLNYNSNTPIGICVASKILTVDSNRNLATIDNLTSIGTLNSTNIYGTILTSSQPNITNLGILTSLNVNNIIITNHDGISLGLKLSNVLVTTSATKLNYLMVTPGIANSNKAIVLDKYRNIRNINNITTISLYTNNLYLNNSLITTSAGQLNYNDINILGIAEANKILTLDANRNIININSLSSTNISVTNITGTLYTVAQPNVTSVGILTGLSVSGTLSVGNNLSLSGTITGIKTLTSSTITGTLLTSQQPNITTIGTQNIVNANNCFITTTNTTNFTINGTSVTSSATKLNYNNIITIGTAEINKSLVLDSNSNISNINNLTCSTLSSANLTGILQTISQPNITSLGTLSSLTVSGDISGVRNINITGDLSINNKIYSNTPVSQFRKILIPYILEFINSDFYNYTLDGDEYNIADGGNDMFDGGNYLQFFEYNSSTSNYTAQTANISYNIPSGNYGIGDNLSFSYGSLGYTTPLVSLVKFTGVQNSSSYFYGIRKYGGLGSDSAGNFDNSFITPTNAYGLNVIAYSMQIYNATDPSVCDLFFIISDSLILSSSLVFVSSTGAADPYTRSFGYRGDNISSSLLMGNILLSRPNANLITTAQLSSVLTQICYRISLLNGITANTIYGTITTPSQPKITSLGNLSGLIVNGNIGVNTSNPSKKIEINNLTGNCLRTYYNKIDYSNVYWDFNINSSGYLTFLPNVSTQKLLIQNNLQVGNNASANLIRFNGITGDAGNDMCVLAERLYSGSDFSELLLFKGNDSTTPSGPDRIRLRSGAIVLQTYNISESYDNYNDDNYRFILDNNNKITLGEISNSILINGNINSSYAQYDLNIKVNSANIPLRLTYNDNNGSATIYNDISLLNNNTIFDNTSNSFILGSSDNDNYQILIGTNDNSSNTCGSLRFVNSGGINYIQSGININKSSATDLFIGNIDTTVLTSSRKFIIKNNGKVGINTINPTYQLDINSSNGNCLELIYNNSLGTATTYSTSVLDNSGNLTFTVYGSAPSYTFTNGNLSTQLLTPIQPNITNLGILSSLNINGNLTGINNLSINTSISTYNLNASYLIGTLLTNKQPFITKIGNIQSLSLQGFIKVGTYSKTLDFLHIDKNINNLIGITIENTNSTNTTSGCQILFSGYSNSSSQYEVAKISSITKNSDNPSLYQYSDLVFSTRRNNSDLSTTEVLRILNTGNIGIGINNPSTTLEVINGINANLLLLGNSTNTSDFLSCNLSTLSNGSNMSFIFGKNITAGNSYIIDYLHNTDNSNNNTLGFTITGNSYNSFKIANNKVALGNVNIYGGLGNSGLNVDGNINLTNWQINTNNVYLNNTTYSSVGMGCSSTESIKISGNGNAQAIQINSDNYYSIGSTIPNSNWKLTIGNHIQCSALYCDGVTSYYVPTSYAYGRGSDGGTGTVSAQTNSYSAIFKNVICSGRVIVSSDIRLKENIDILDNNYCLNFINNIKSYSYNLKSDNNDLIYFGFIAQELLKYNFRDLITFVDDENMNEEIDENGFISPANSRLLVSIKQVLPILANCLKIYYNEINSIEDKINLYSELNNYDNIYEYDFNNTSEINNCKYKNFISNKDKLYNNLLEIENNYIN